MEKLLTEDSQIINIILTAIGLLLLMAVAVIVFFYFSRKRIIRTELEKANLEISYQKEIIQATIITQEEERKRIAQDLHDAISSKLNVVSLKANMLMDVAISSEETNKTAESILSITATVLESSRKIAHDLLPPTLDKFGLQAALEELCEELEETRKFKISYNLKYIGSLLDPDEELHLFRVVQELFNNAIKHSQATEIKLSLFTKENTVSLEYKDNGKGFELENALKAKGLGMSGIDNRLIILNGKLKMETSPFNGLNVTITLER